MSRNDRYCIFFISSPLPPYKAAGNLYIMEITSCNLGANSRTHPSRVAIANSFYLSESAFG
ncbi:hypothetical protein CW304_24125 [Bacillus sp. UFRGS-B20]|nr:hypothetical protein CW304_24125 [Bacillus sp. UFRGS-B20]